MCRCWVAYRTSTPQGAAQVTLKSRMISTSIRTGGFRHSQRRPSAISVCTFARPDPAAPVPEPVEERAGTGVLAMREISTTARLHAHHLEQERPRVPGREQEGAERGTGELIRDEEAGLQPGVAEPEVGRLQQHRQQCGARRVDEHFRGAVQERGDQHDPDVRGAGDQEHAQRDEHDRARGVRDHDQAATIEAVGDRSGVQAEHQPGQELQDRARGHQERRGGHRRDQQGSGGQGHAVTRRCWSRMRPAATGSRGPADGAR